MHQEFEDAQATPVELADFWLPEDEDAIRFGFGSDPRHWVEVALREMGVEIEPAVVVEDPRCPPAFLGISTGFIHTTAHGLLTKELFGEMLAGALKNLVDMIGEQYDPFQPIRFYRPAQPSYGVSPYTFAGDDYPFDLRIIGMAERSIAFPNLDGETVHAPGHKWMVSTMIVPDADRDREVHVATDWGKAYDA